MKRKLWFRIYKGFINIFRKRTKFVFLGEEFKDQGIILSNHAGTGGPFAYELNQKKPIRFWGTYEMNSGIKQVYHYLVHTYYHQKKGWNLGLAYVFCLLAAPLTNLFYRGMNLISSYPDSRITETMAKSFETLKEPCNIVIFPEDSSKGYFDELTKFHSGFVVFIKFCLKRGLDLPLYVSYYEKRTHVQLVDSPIMLSDLFSENESREEIAKKLCDRCNELGRIARSKNWRKTNKNKK